MRDGRETLRRHEEEIRKVKREKAERLFRDNVTVYGSKEAALRALDCKSEAEAISMLTLAVEPKWCPLSKCWM